MSGHSHWGWHRVRGAAARLALLVLLLAGAAGAASSARAQEPVATGPITIEGVALRQVLDSPVPLYVAPSVSDAKMGWMRDAIAVALDAVPRITDLPLPQARLEFYLFNDPRELASLSSQVLRSPGPGVSPECFSVAQGSTPRRGIYCQADAWSSADEALDYVSHELTHQVEQGDTTQRRGIAQWFNEGLAEYVQGRVLAEHSPAYAARDRWQREARVASALHTDRLLSMRDLSTNQRWQQAAGSGWAGQIYSHSSLVIDWLANSYGLPAVIDVVRRTGAPYSFEAAFEQALGLTVADADRDARRALEADLLERYPTGLSVLPTEGASGRVLNVAVVGFQPRENLEKEYHYANGTEATGAAADGTRPEMTRTDASGFASWTWTAADAPPPGVPATVELTVHGSSGSEATQSAPLPTAP
ncbi:MAG TPA: hypothetical protein VII06_26615 [Chloroflexota bacterium]